MPEALDILASRGSPFSEFSRELQTLLLSVMRVCHYQAGDYLMRQGERGEYLLLILEGTACAYVRYPVGDARPIAEFSAGAVVGEISLLTDEPRTADVIATTAARVLLLTVTDFHRLADAHPQLRIVLTFVLAERLGQATHDGLSGKDIHGYRIVRRVGRGGMGIVYEGVSLATGATIALKMMSHALLYQPAAIQRFRREADALRSFHHESIGRLYDHFAAYKTEFLVMEFCEGVTLAQHLASQGSLDEAAVQRIIGQLADTLHYVHLLGLTHNDLKPSNVMIGPSGRTKLLDFGLVKFSRDAESRAPEEATTSQPFTLLGTPRYMAPEQFSSEPTDYRVDVYGLACIAYELLTGRPVVTSSDLFAMIQEKHAFVLPSRHDIGPGVTTAMHAFLAHGLEARPGKRAVDLHQVARWAGPVELPVDQ
jgi:CRP-like cAMP-binding protein